MRTDRAFLSLDVGQIVSHVLRSWRERFARRAQFDNADSSEMLQIANDLGTSVSELRVLASHGEGAADLLKRRLCELSIDPTSVDPGVMRDLQRCCTQCGDKTLCKHELEDQPRTARWPAYCPNEQTIEALAAEKKS